MTATPIPRHAIDQRKAPRPQLHAAIPPRHHNHGVPNLHQLQQVQQPAARRILPVVVAVVVAHAARAADAPRRDVVRRRADALVRPEEVLQKELRLGGGRHPRDVRYKGRFVLHDDVGERPWRRRHRCEIHLAGVVVDCPFAPICVLAFPFNVVIVILLFLVFLYPS
ncbi:hypothetical protein MKX08_002068 [Trichoderma sp. CBMAI-0020]|nr:hypothetical protein MKX08_002068 [Trichoderma sp. CBMAI-0020]